MSRRRPVCMLALLLLSIMLQPWTVQAQSSFTVSATVVDTWVTLTWDYPLPDPYTFLCTYQINDGPVLTCGYLNGDSREDTQYLQHGIYVFWLEAQNADGSAITTSNQVTVTVDAIEQTDVPSTPELPTPTISPMMTSVPSTPTVSPTSETPTIPAMTPIPTVVLQLTTILSTTAQVAADQRDAWDLGSDSAQLFLSLAAIVLVVGLILFFVEQFRS